MSSDLAQQLAASQAEVARLHQIIATSMRPDQISIGTILTEVAEEFGVREHILRSEARAHFVTKPRQAVMGLARALTGRSYPTIARVLRRDHTTVCFGCRAHEERMTRDPDYAARVRAVSERLERRLNHV